MRKTLASWTLIVTFVLVGCQTVTPGERDVSRVAPVQVGLSMVGGDRPVPIVEAEPLVFSFDQIEKNRDALARSGVLTPDGKRLRVSWMLGQAPRLPARIEVRIVGQEAIAAGESWEAAAGRLNARLKDRPYCGPVSAPVASCRREGGGTTCEIEATGRSVFKYDVRVFATSAPGQDSRQLSCLDPWGMIN